MTNARRKATPASLLPRKEAEDPVDAPAPEPPPATPAPPAKPAAARSTAAKTGKKPAAKPGSRRSGSKPAAEQGTEPGADVTSPGQSFMETYIDQLENLRLLDEKREQRSFNIPRPLLERARAAAYHVMQFEGEPGNLGELATNGILFEVLRLEHEYNGGKPFHAVRRLPTGPSLEGAERMRRMRQRRETMGE